MSYDNHVAPLVDPADQFGGEEEGSVSFGRENLAYPVFNFPTYLGHFILKLLNFDICLFYVHFYI